MLYNFLWYNLVGGLVSNIFFFGFIKMNLMFYLVCVNYVYKDKYFVIVSICFDGLLKLVEGNKWGSFLLVVVVWRVLGEEFMKSLFWLSNLKLCLSYG